MIKGFVFRQAGWHWWIVWVEVGWQLKTSFSNFVRRLVSFVVMAMSVMSRINGNVVSVSSLAYVLILYFLSHVKESHNIFDTSPDFESFSSMYASRECHSSYK